jgi:hypothetical protein
MQHGILAAAAAIGLAASAYAPGTVAQDQGNGGFYGNGHAENHDWYSKLKQPGTTYSCCNGNEHGGDCRPTHAFLGDDGFWHAQVDGRWTTVPKRAELDQPAPDGSSHICASKGGYIFCFIGGSPKS